MGVCLIVANQTVGGRELEQAIKERVAAGTAFHVVVPMTEPRYETDAWAADTAALRIRAEPAGDPIEEARRRSEQRLEAILVHIRGHGCAAEGEVGEQDPARAARRALDGREVDEVLVSTLPSRLSRWLRLDVPSRIQRTTGVSVSVVEAEG